MDCNAGGPFHVRRGTRQIALPVAGVALANPTRDDVLYDLGSGDGRIVIEAARRFGTRGLGVDIDPVRVEEATANARRRGVQDRARFRRQDLFETDLRPASIVTLYLFQHLNLELRPRLFQQLRPGTRVVSHAFHMGDWQPDTTVRVRGTRAPAGRRCTPGPSRHRWGGGGRSPLRRGAGSHCSSGSSSSASPGRGE